jgi:hypothetical protein
VAPLNCALSFWATIDAKFSLVSCRPFRANHYFEGSEGGLSFVAPFGEGPSGQRMTGAKHIPAGARGFPDRFATTHEPNGNLTFLARLTQISRLAESGQVLCHLHDGDEILIDLAASSKSCKLRAHESGQRRDHAGCVRRA